MIDWPSQEPVCYLFGVPRIVNMKRTGLTEVTLLTVTEEDVPERPSSVWVPVALDLDVATAYYHREHPSGHSIITLSNADGVWALWLELVHVARRYGAEGLMVILRVDPELWLEPFSRDWFTRQYLARTRPIQRQLVWSADKKHMKGAN